MHVLVPDDPVFLAKFQSLEELLLRRLYRLQLADPECEEGRVVADAYDSWVRVLLKLPAWPRWQEDVSPPGALRTEYTLYGPRGTQLTSLYPVELDSADLEQLTLCLRAFLSAGADRGFEPRCTRREPERRGPELVHVFRRVMGVLLLPCPPELMHTLGRVREGAPAVTLSLKEEVQYRRYCTTVVRILSLGDQFAYQNHLAMYP
ncbi:MULTISPECIES: hypothetical protein [Kitasatospora]|uniref:Uncharacterized protein n=1 Tax=Kitasatospora cathayae TaxID=3004092 RepID=A0ABY7Q0S4_9ACTN|nr:hypothetical protein [Kitasatospora sp. HUAS 3-15]WBP86278.1 hypothetical protein O1G21_10760 [Kitasatospora sp. HUAS 3-15]